MEAAAERLRAAWFVKVRWGAVAGQVLAIGVSAVYLDVGYRPLLLLGLSAVTVVSNGWLAWRLRRDAQLAPRVAGAVLVFDTLVLTALLYATGGPSNPFSVLYLVQITVAAVMLGSRWAWAIAGFSSLCYAALFALPHQPMSGMATHVHGQWTFSLHLEGMWLALVTAAALTAYFVTRLTSALERRESELAAMREVTARQQRLAAITTLAAGAAHELATPMATIAVAARELERAVDRPDHAAVDRLRDDVRLIRAEVARCGDILRRMSPGGDAEAEPVARTPLAALLDDAVLGLSRAEASRVQVSCGEATGSVEGPRGALTAAIISLVRNGLDASSAPEPVVITGAVEQSWALISVRDRGAGMTGEVLSRAGEPFFTTKAPGRGMGLGLFLARSLAERLGGNLSIQSAPGAGTVATVRLPLAERAEGIERDATA